MQYRLDEAVDLLGRTPGTLRALLAGLPDQWTRSNEGAETFSPFDVVGHLIDGEETDWMVRAAIILRQGPDLTFQPYRLVRYKTA